MGRHNGSTERMSTDLPKDVVEVASHDLSGRLRRDEYPEYYAGILENGGVIWTSSASHATKIWHESLPATVATIRQSPWLRSIKGLRWEISLPITPDNPPP